MRHVGQVSIGSYEHISGMVMAGHMSYEVIRAFILKALMLLVFIRTFPSSLLLEGLWLVKVRFREHKMLSKASRT